MELTDEELIDELKLVYLPEHVKMHRRAPKEWKIAEDTIVAHSNEVKISKRAMAMYAGLPKNLKRATSPHTLVMVGYVPANKALRNQRIYLNTGRNERIFKLNLAEKQPIKRVSKQLRRALCPEGAIRYDIYDGEENLRKHSAEKLVGRNTTKWVIRERTVNLQDKKRAKEEKKRRLKYTELEKSKEPGHHKIDVWVEELHRLMLEDWKQQARNRGSSSSSRRSQFDCIQHPTSAIPLISKHMHRHPHGRKSLQEFGIYYPSMLQQQISSNVQQTLGQQLVSTGFKPENISCIFDTGAVSDYMKDFFARFRAYSQNLNPCHRRRVCSSRPSSEQVSLQSEPLAPYSSPATSPGASPVPSPTSSPSVTPSSSVESLDLYEAKKEKEKEEGKEEKEEESEEYASASSAPVSPSSSPMREEPQVEATSRPASPVIPESLGSVPSSPEPESESLASVPSSPEIESLGSSPSSPRGPPPLPLPRDSAKKSSTKQASQTQASQSQEPSPLFDNYKKGEFEEPVDTGLMSRVFVETPIGHHLSSRRGKGVDDSDDSSSDSFSHSSDSSSGSSSSSSSGDEAFDIGSYLS